MQLDKTDAQIISILWEDGRAPNTAIAKKLNISESTVRKRINRMREEKLVRIIGASDPAKFGFPILVMVFLKVKPDYLMSAAEALTAMKETHLVAITTGSSDIVFRSAFKSAQHLLDFLVGPISKLDGLISIETHLILKVMKRTFAFHLSESE